MTFGEILREKRLAADISQHDLALMVGTSRVMIANYEFGHNEPGLNIAIKLSKALGFSIDDLDCGLPSRKTVQEQNRKHKLYLLKKEAERLNERIGKLEDGK